MLRAGSLGARLLARLVLLRRRLVGPRQERQRRPHVGPVLPPVRRRDQQRAALLQRHGDELRPPRRRHLERHAAHLPGPALVRAQRLQRRPRRVRERRRHAALCSALRRRWISKRTAGGARRRS
ncbi:MAG: hypothetical protein CMH59_20410, partial [Myxococcales bacterium]|nr:hypothetical protein [Myxococcales bacterium]